MLRLSWIGFSFVLLIAVLQARAEGRTTATTTEPIAELLVKSKAEPTSEPITTEPIWEYGLGVGFVRFEQYPAAGEYSELLLPVPTFQYRGRRLRADDREGAKAYLWKQENWTLEMSGTGTPSLDSDDNALRKGMKDLPWILAVGPQLVYDFNPDFDFSLGVFQAVATDFSDTRMAGAFFEGKFTYISEKILQNKIKSLTQYFLTFKSASQEIQDQYFGVSHRDVTTDRPFYHAQAGFLSMEASVFQSLKKGRTAFYIGANYSDYQFSKNRKSPLYRARSQFNYLFGITYVLGESSRPEVKAE